MRIYSPTQTEDYLFCPMLRALKSGERWVPLRAGKKDLAGILGAGFHAAMAEHNRHNSEAALCVETGLVCMAERLQDLERAGRVIDPADYPMRDALSPRLTVAVTKFLAQNPIPATWRTQKVEFEIPNSGGSRLDLVVHDGRAPVIIDYKLKLTLGAYYREKEFARIRRSWQLYHYAHFYGAHVGVPVERFIVLMVVLEPRFEIIPLDRTTVILSPEKLALWRTFAERTWADMEAEDTGVREPRGQTFCETPFGPCEMLDACWTFMYDEGLMQTKYVRRS